MSSFKPMLATDADLNRLVFPLFASPKLDGIRCSIVGGRALTRTLKEVPNRHVFNALSHDHYNGLDGELIIGPTTAHDVYRETVSGVMSHDGLPEVTYWVFDVHDYPAGYHGRYQELGRLLQATSAMMHGVRIQSLPQTLISNLGELKGYEESAVDRGYEGVILRGLNAPYKRGRSTVREGYLLKLKRFMDGEAQIIGVEEEMHNGNEATTNELGRTKRSTAKAGLTGKNRMGKLKVRDLMSGVEFHIGTGFTDLDKAWFWDEDPIGLVVKYKFFPVGVKDLPRHPVYLGLRDRRDM